jgi:hypothetical protein
MPGSAGGVRQVTSKRFDDDMGGIDGRMLDHLLSTGWPVDDEPRNLPSGTQPDGYPRIMGRKIAASATSVTNNHSLR